MTDVKKEVKNYLKKENLSANRFAESIGVSSALLSQWLSGKYTGNNEQIDELVFNFLRSVKFIKDASQTALFESKKAIAEIDSVRRITSVCSMCLTEGEIAVVCGEAGTGKSVASSDFARKHNSVYVEVNVSYTAKILFLEIAEKVSAGGGKTINDIFRNIVQKIKGSKRLIIIDEAEHLPYKALDLLRSLHDASGCGIVFIGLERLIYNLRGNKGEYAQIYSRISVYQKTLPLSFEDAQNIVEFMDFNLSQTVIKTLLKTAVFNARRFNKLLKSSKRIAGLNSCEITPEVIASAKEDLVS